MKLTSFLALVLAASLATRAHGQESLELTPRTITAGVNQYSAEIGRLPVSENREVEGSRTIHLAFARLKSTAAEPGPPTFVLPGGPGNSATALAASPIWRNYLELGDVVLMDPRGVGRSEPDLNWTAPNWKPELLFTNREKAIEHLVEVGAQAAEHFETQGVDLRGYTTVQMVEDYEQLRRALGYTRVHVIGHSFGTHMGLVWMRRHPDSVARFISVGTAGTDEIMKLPSELDRSFKQLSDRIANDPVLAEELPDAFATMQSIVDDLARKPLGILVRDARSGQAKTFELGPLGAQLILLADLGDTCDLPVIPRLLHSLANRDVSMVQWFFEKRLRQFGSLPGLMFTVRASSGATPARWKQIRAEAQRSPFGLARCLFSPELDAALGAQDLGAEFRKPVTSAVPSLFISGTLDANTPPWQAERVRSGFSSSGHLVVQDGGHEDLLPNPEVQKRMLEFLRGGSPRDETIQGRPLRFAPLTGRAAGFEHPALSAR